MYMKLFLPDLHKGIRESDFLFVCLFLGGGSGRGNWDCFPEMYLLSPEKASIDLEHRCSVNIMQFNIKSIYTKHKKDLKFLSSYIVGAISSFLQWDIHSYNCPLVRLRSKYLKDYPVPTSCHRHGLDQVAKAPSILTLNTPMDIRKFSAAGEVQLMVFTYSAFSQSSSAVRCTSDEHQLPFRCDVTVTMICHVCSNK